MMLYPAMNDLLKQVPSRYQLVNVVAHRAREIAAEAEDEGYPLEDKPVSIAIREVADGKVTGEQIPTLEEVLTELRGKVWFNLDKCGSDDVDIAKVYEVVKR